MGRESEAMERGEQGEPLALDLGKRRSKEVDEEEEEEEEGEEREIEELEREVKAMAEKILESRRTMPERVLDALSSDLVAQRPVIPQIESEFTSSSSLPGRSAQAGMSGDLSSELQEDVELSEGESLAEANPVVLQKLRTFRDKTASNIAAMPVILKRMNECIARLDRIDQYNVNLHSAFKRKRK